VLGMYEFYVRIVTELSRMCCFEVFRCKFDVFCTLILHYSYSLLISFCSYFYYPSSFRMDSSGLICINDCLFDCLIDRLVVNVCRFQEIAGAVETALYTPFAEAAGWLCLSFLFLLDAILLMNSKK